MKSLYTVALLLLSIGIYAQESKTSDQQDQTLILKNAKEQQAQVLKDLQQNADKKTAQTGLASDQGLEVKKQTSKSKAPSESSGKLLPNTASFEEVLATIPNRHSSRKASTFKKQNTTGLSNTATLAEIKKTIPKN
ncbi:hypothetical protein CEY12_15065 [Chryseobacterium sp. T16E-39]|uniref:hypothetical protein n=1 Tax=Chryseobacterium sp. T16E-39 TaxID=2015076 RepID=UPI000B5B3F87|nr:hypothetical protein [Chryseobacterium sp. T16E-39]ASK31344.1 hypothetical protein CEY12_15065 [Chryseobacterium sp. T16E-39]